MSRQPVRVVVAQPNIGHMAPWAHQSQVVALHHAWAQNVIHGFSFVGDTYIDRARNECVNQARGLDATHIFWVDCDMILPEDTIVALLGHHRLVVGGLYHRRRAPYDPVAWTFGPNGRDMDLLTEIKDGGLQRVDGVGTGCLLTSMEVFNETEWPWFLSSMQEDDGVPCFIGDDIHFSMLLWRKRIPVWLDTDVKCGHVTDVIITHEDWLAHKDEDAGPCPEPTS